MSLCGTDYAVGGAVRNMWKESRGEGTMVTMPSKLSKGLPRRTGSLCPECLKVIPATLYIGDGALKMRKTCREHGEFDEVCWSDAEMYLKAENWAFDGVGLENPSIVDAKVCPYECGLCNLHYSHTALCNIDLTNRCNLKCPICFANANAAGYVFEPTFEQIIYEFAVLRAQRPIAVTSISTATTAEHVTGSHARNVNRSSPSSPAARYVRLGGTPVSCPMSGASTISSGTSSRKSIPAAVGQ